MFVIIVHSANVFAIILSGDFIYMERTVLRDIIAGPSYKGLLLLSILFCEPVPFYLAEEAIFLKSGSAGSPLESLNRVPLLSVTSSPST